jgi:hypothetical protein
MWVWVKVAVHAFPDSSNEQRHVQVGLSVIVSLFVNPCVCVLVIKSTYVLETTGTGVRHDAWG